MTDTGGMDPAAVHKPAPLALVALASAMYGALAICVTGFASLLTDTDVISVPGIGPVPGAAAVLVSVACFAGALWPTLNPPRPSYLGVVPVALAATLAHLAALWVLAVLLDAGFATATAAVGASVTSWTSPAFLGVAIVAAWGGIAVRRTAARPPHWPWERPDDGE